MKGNALPARRYLVTGGAGAIGSNLVRALLGRGARVTVLDDFSSGHREFVPDEVDLVVGSVADDDDVNRALADRPDVVFHLAALFANQNSVEHPQLDLTVNGGGTLRVLRAAAARGVRKVVYTSSSCVYGDDPVMREDDLDLRPHTPYAITKLLGERYACFLAEHEGLDVVTVRLFNVYGPFELPGLYRNVIPNFFALAFRGAPLPVTGTGDETRDFTFMDDVVRGLIAVADAETEPGDVFNLGSGTETRILDLAQAINDLTGNAAGIELHARRTWDKVNRRRSDITKARAAFGFEPSTSLEDGLAATHAWLAAKWASLTLA